MAPHSAVRKQMVETDLSPPDKDFITLVLSSTSLSEYTSFGPLWTFTCKTVNNITLGAFSTVWSVVRIAQFLSKLSGRKLNH